MTRNVLKRRFSSGDINLDHLIFLPAKGRVFCVFFLFFSFLKISVQLLNARVFNVALNSRLTLVWGINRRVFLGVAISAKSDDGLLSSRW